MEKESMEINVMWHIDALIHLFPVTIVTTVDDEGKVITSPQSGELGGCEPPQGWPITRI